MMAKHLFGRAATVALAGIAVSAAAQDSFNQVPQGQSPGQYPQAQQQYPQQQVPQQQYPQQQYRQQQYPQQRYPQQQYPQQQYPQQQMPQQQYPQQQYPQQQMPQQQYPPQQYPQQQMPQQQYPPQQYPQQQMPQQQYPQQYPPQPGNPMGGKMGGSVNLDQLEQMERQDFGVKPTKQLHSGAMHGPTPSSIPGGQVVSTKGLVALVQGNQTPYIILDVLGSGEILPGAQSAVPASQAGSFNDQTQKEFGDYLQQATQGRKDVTLVLYCLSNQCWMSYNAALRAINLGYTSVLWYRGGIEAWKAAGMPTMGPAGFPPPGVAPGQMPPQPQMPGQQQRRPS